MATISKSACQMYGRSRSTTSRNRDKTRLLTTMFVHVHAHARSEAEDYLKLALEEVLEAAFERGGQ